ncbi:MAG: hypothetical protein ACC742_12015 [Thermoanaerobaculales bacterium]
MARDEQDGNEIDYYREVEDLFATLRGVPHMLSPKDFHLMRQWWRDGVPLMAVRAGITEVLAKRQERGDSEPVVSLSYCRHAVAAHARRLAAMRVGAPDENAARSSADAASAMRALAGRLAETADRQRPQRPAIAGIVDGIAREIEGTAELPADGLEKHLFALETALLTNCRRALDDSSLDEIEERARQRAAATAATPDSEKRAFRALRDKMLRELLALPRLELEG